MELDLIGMNIIAFYAQAMHDVQSLATHGIKSEPLRRMVEGHYIEMSWELSSYLWNNRDGRIDTLDATISVDEEGGIHGRFHRTPGWWLYAMAMHSTIETSATEYVRHLTGQGG